MNQLTLVLPFALTPPELAQDLARAMQVPATWSSLPEAQRDTLRSLEVTLLNVATDLVTQAVGKVLDDAQQSVDDLLAVTSQARDVIGRIADVKQNIAIATALIGLAAAISAGGAGAIFGAFKLVKDTTGAKAAKAGKEKAKAKKKASEPAAAKGEKSKSK
eukprot:gene29455-36514_t